MSIARLLTVPGLALALLVLSACVAGPDYQSPDISQPTTFSRSIERESDQAGDAMAVWWSGFEDQTLSAVVEEALAANLDIAQGVQRLVAADALTGAARSDFLPVIDGGANYSLRSSGSDSASASLSLSQIIDTNGRLQRARERAEAERLAAQFNLDDVRRLTAGSAALRYVDLRRAEARLALLDTSLELQQRTLDIVERRAEAGLSADLDVRRATSDLARTRAQRGALELQLARSSNALAILLAQSPGGELAVLGAGARDNPLALGLAFNSAIPVGAPAEFLRRRPDIRGAEARLVAATANVGIQAAELYPSLRLPGSVSADFSDGVSAELIGGLSAVLDIPLFDFGRRQAELTAAEARAAEAALAYQQAVLSALEEVETGLVAIESVEARLEDLQIAVAQGEQAYEQLNALYREGLASFIDVLDAQRTLIGNREALVDTEADLARAIIDLNLALATSVSS